MMLRHMGIEEKLEIEHLYLGWFDEWNGQIYNYDHDEFTNGAMPGSHSLYDSTIEDISIIIPWQESELSVPGGGLINNATGKLDYALYAKRNKFNAQGYFDYSSCLNAPDYEVGSECKMMVSGDQWISYFPLREEIPENLEQQDVTDAEDSSNQQTIINVMGNQGNQNNQGTQNAQETGVAQGISADSSYQHHLESQTSIDNQSNTKGIKTPETGGYSEENEKSIQLPWWIAAIDIIGVITFLWLFAPTSNSQIRKKIRKSFKKGLDKIKGLR